MWCGVEEREPLKRRCSMKCDAPALASVSSREPAPIQKPIATERTLGIRSEITRSPESSSERTYFCTAAVSVAGQRPRLAESRNKLAMGLEEAGDELVDLSQRELRGRVRVQHGRVVDVFPFPGQGGLASAGLAVHGSLE